VKSRSVDKESGPTKKCRSQSTEESYNEETTGEKDSITEAQLMVGI